ncbi:hypothetical protein MM236_07415 [Belliella sp. DSM 107340]|uniref:Restriction endonuclease n=1 Tax=Belliella calami TaxID=2923436 RepID=A0ABS9UNQ1_9BACT|nr:hypothetical protein [Belliella calami]MCH7397810.1 hypothetical protein [Belliella calami]
MFGSLDASNFSGSIPFYDNEFEKILSKITFCYRLMKTDNVALENDENKIRDVLVNQYINNSSIKRKIEFEYFIFPEVPETGTSGRTDIRIHNPNRFYDQDEYYIIECKRLDNVKTTGTSGLNAKYIRNGLDRFVCKYYASFYRMNGMIGFIVEDLEIDENMRNINTLLTTSFTSIKTTKVISRDTFINEFEFHYSSIHTDEDNNQLKIYHLMFDFSENIQH